MHRSGALLNGICKNLMQSFLRSRRLLILQSTFCRLNQTGNSSGPFPDRPNIRNDDRIAVLYLTTQKVRLKVSYIDKPSVKCRPRQRLTKPAQQFSRRGPCSSGPNAGRSGGRSDFQIRWTSAGQFGSVGPVAGSARGATYIFNLRYGKPALEYVQMGGTDQSWNELGARMPRFGWVAAG